MTKQQADPRRDVTATDLEVIDKAIADHEKFQTTLYTLRKILTEVGKVDAKRADLSRGVEAEQARLDDVRLKANAAQEQLDKLQNDIASKQRELAAVEATIQERTIASNQLNEGYLRLRAILEAA
jgi:peptidoglycan hydrolase CwlO-like protein